MRRLLILCLMLIVPLQSTWAAVASACRHEVGSAAQHVGHHAHAHEASAAAADASGPADSAADPAADEAAFDADCAHCHGCGAALIGLPVLPTAWAAAQLLFVYAGHLPDPVPDNPLRPPLSRLV